MAPPAFAQGRPAVDFSACQTLTRHRPAADVEYRPGVDVRGRPVAPADLPGSAPTVPLDRFDIPVSGDLARVIGLNVPGRDSNVQVGWLSLEGNHLFFNGQPIGGPAEAELYAYCRSR
ncbi:hypothetical protein ACIU1J_19270 [Azospirillum doebereinerae]|uniref:hypothetical protein n=1 Tax=Azospirillum doebereinerae TaxID=92933 RepID=UPI00384AFDEF